MEYSESIPSIGVSNIVSELTNLRVLWTDIETERWTHGILLCVIPVTVSIRTSSMVASDDVVGMSDPNASRSLVSVQ